MITTQIVSELVGLGLDGDDLIDALKRIDASLMTPNDVIVTSAVTPGAMRQRKYAERKKASANDVINDASLNDAKDTPLVPPLLSPEPLSSPPIIPPENIRAIAKTKEKQEEHPLFEDFWTFYPKRLGANPRSTASVSFNRQVSRGADPPSLVSAAKSFATDARNRGEAGTAFVPMASTWLNQERWKDQQAVVKEVLPTNGRVYVEYGTDAGDSWTSYFRSKGKIPPRDVKGGWWFDSEFPPALTGVSVAEEKAANGSWP